ncbi:hypothetical protein AB6884_13055 [Carnobacterium maltaromaticum]|uniref:hypothetical protein n=1 Tax=Carnobacterium maltaromaticum TaxID=2751 RepID=UPI0039BDB485
MEKIGETILENGKYEAHEISPAGASRDFKVTNKEANKFVVLKISIALITSLENHNEPFNIFLTQVLGKTMLLLERTTVDLEIELTSSNSFSGNVKNIMDENELEAIAKVI